MDRSGLDLLDRFGITAEQGCGGNPHSYESASENRWFMFALDYVAKRSRASVSSVTL